jgi:hypothetical protein
VCIRAGRADTNIVIIFFAVSVAIIFALIAIYLLMTGHHD